MNRHFRIMFPILFMVLSIMSIDLRCQERVVESRFVEIQFNNLQDTTAPLIGILSPVPTDEGAFKTQKEELNVIGEIQATNTIKYATFDDAPVSVNDLGIFHYKVMLEPGANSYVIVASDVKGNRVEKSFLIEYDPPVVALADKIKLESKYYALIIGIEEYEDPELPDLSNPISDAKKLKEALVSQYTFEDENVDMILDASRNDIIIALDDLSKRVTPDDNVLIFYAGHGTWDERAGVGYWLPRDAYLNSTINWFRNSTLVDYLKLIDSKHTLLITDACFAGSIFQSRSVKPKEDRAYEVLYNLNSRKAMTSGTLTEVPDKSPFAQYLIERLTENTETYLSSESLFSSFRLAVIYNSEVAPQYGEIRNVGDEGGEFIFLKREQ